MHKPNLLPFLSLLFLFIACREASPPEQDTDLQAFADSLFQNSIDSQYIAGAAVMVMRGEDVLLDTAYGYGSLELDVPMPMHASFEIGSVTKQFTAAAILKLEEMGKLSLKDDFTQYLDFDTKGRTVSIGQLLDHTSVIASYTEMEAFWPFSLHSYERDSLVRMVEQEPFLFEPGRALIYNNSAYYFLGLIIEKVSGQSYEEFLKAQFFDPLGMEDTYYCTTSKVIPNKVYGYNYAPDGLQQKPYLDHTWPYAAGSLCSTTADLMKWLQALHADRFLGEALYQALVTPEPLDDGTPVRYAKGLSNMVYHGHPMISHGGGIHGFLSETRYFPEDDLYIVCLVNTTGPHGGGYFADALTWKLLDKRDPAGQELDLDPATLAGTYSGQARGRRMSIDVAAADGALTVKVDRNENPDTLDLYLGNHTWQDGNQTIRIADDEMRLDMPYGHYILKKE